jgi:hypothetical protein
MESNVLRGLKEPLASIGRMSPVGTKRTNAIGAVMSATDP